MKKIIHSASKVLVAASLMVLTACRVQEAEPSVEISTETVVNRIQEIASAFAGEDWAAVSAAFSADKAKTDTAEVLEERYSGITQKGCSGVTEAIPLIEDTGTKGYSLIGCGEERYLLSFTFDNALKVSDMSASVYPNDPVTEETDAYYERVVYFGKLPMLYGILTIPKDVEDPSVAILVPDGLANERDASGKDPEFRKNLAHDLAEMGMAAFRYDQRMYQMPEQFADIENCTPEALFQEDLASAIHLLENYEVDASDILFVTHGSSSSFIFETMYDHFELTEAVVLEGTLTGGIDFFVQQMHLSEEIGLEVKKTLAVQDDLSEEIGGISTELWLKWQRISSTIYADYINERVLLLSPREVSRDWLTMTQNLNRTAKNYKKDWLTTNFYNPDREYSNLPARDIFLWLCGEDINESEDETKK